ncbi:26S proteasome regulatory subunit N8 [Fonticula alba]|uniref:26S proteasome regulatory subunit N8 n=1 Tax=Fonticula alba TaxID=691883 RepID=A0A058ZC51_FONAL|nr:26S proteasome regulatory subunit N8 [Fonticula alba]KCV71513.1 26S proteasome regulatory subunit N8 [Fonticula alba]|eukprot:XP_009494636.1 26S proteasome regulatory subunit N8 [Fonticula alba]
MSAPSAPGATQQPQDAPKDVVELPGSHVPGMIPTSVVVHPLVLLSVVDHYNRVAKGTTKRVVGVLLGQWNGSTIDVSNSYAVPFEEEGQDSSIWFFDHGYLEEMWHMFRKINAREKIIGWYHTGPALRSSDLAIHSVMSRFCPNPVLVTIDVNPECVGLPTESFVAIEEVDDSINASTSSESGPSSRKTFTQVSTEVRATEAEEIGVEHLLRDVKDNAVSSLATQVTEKVSSMRSLHNHLKDIATYLQMVADGRIQPNPVVLTNAQALLAGRPDISGSDALSAAFTSAGNDAMLVLHIAAMCRSLTALHDLIRNRQNVASSEQTLAAAAAAAAAERPAATPSTV